MPRALGLTARSAYSGSLDVTGRMAPFAQAFRRYAENAEGVSGARFVPESLETRFTQEAFFPTKIGFSADAAVVKGQRHGTILKVPGAVVENYVRTEQELQARAPKPILDGFTADPAIRVFGDTYYVYPTSDKPNWNTTDFSVWSSKNLVDWKKEGMIFDVTKDL